MELLHHLALSVGRFMHPSGVVVGIARRRELRSLESCPKISQMSES
jgi:hypothetical protein